ncbi:hypothetical protein DZK26_00935 [Wenzhouxiangella sp. 15190]|nr:hypothetical protein DZK26_00935 [Wenzhouxiangella sp. 15190]
MLRLNEEIVMKERRLILILAGCLIALSALPALADSPFTQPGPESGMVVGTPGRPANNIYPVRVVEIDGQNISPREVMWLKPGKYTFTVSALVRNPPGLSAMRGRVRTQEGMNEIEVVVEAGKAYYIGAHYEGRERDKPYNLVVYRVEEQE